jgi:hypothetical protein
LGVPPRWGILEETMPTNNSKDPWKLRRCKNCKLIYKPTGKDRGNAERSIFCTRKCKDKYHRSGGMNIDQLREFLSRATAKALKADETFIAELSDRLRASNMAAMVRQIAQEEIQKECSEAPLGTIRMVINGVSERELELTKKVATIEAREREILKFMMAFIAGKVPAQQAAVDAFAPGDH